jgi:predicted DNA binding CopG/RHH family protein
VFLHQPLLLPEDTKHSGAEPRFHALGKSFDGRLLHVSFTARGAGIRVRVISVRPCIGRKELCMKKLLKPIPKFRSITAERKFWETHETTQYLDWSQAQPARFPKLKPSTKSISLRLPVHLLERIKVEANSARCPVSVAHQGLARRAGWLTTEKSRRDWVSSYDREHPCTPRPPRASILHRAVAGGVSSG